MRQLNNTHEEMTMRKDTTQRILLHENSEYRDRTFTEGEGIFLTKPSGFRKIEDTFPTRKRADSNPLNRKDYMLHVLHAY